jgi:hypothetical protein
MNEIVENRKQKRRKLQESANKNEWKCGKLETQMKEIGHKNE